MLCITCNAISFTVVDEHLEYRHHEDFQTLEFSAIQGCRMCTIIFHALCYPQNGFKGTTKGDEWLLKHRADTEPIVLIIHGNHDGSAPTVRNWNHIVINRIGIKAVVDVMDLDDDYVALSKPGVEDDTIGSSNSLDLASLWLRNCMENHDVDICRPAQFSTLPTRVLDVGVADGSQQVKLYVPQAPQQALYAALSHCWGTRQTITTTQAKLAAHQNGLSWHHLSLTFQQAIQIVRRLGIRYLWIDSLCIIQDSKSDWEIESSRMGSIYLNAVVTIAAANAKGGDEGCFSTRNAWANRPCKLNIDFPNGRSVYASTTRSPRAVGPLYDRAWVYQEEVLSQRYIAFGDDTILWACPSKVATENLPQGARGGGTLSTHRRYLGEQIKGWSPTSRASIGSSTSVYDLAEDADEVNETLELVDEESRDEIMGLDEDYEESGSDDENIYDMWNEAVQEYNRGSLTVPTDRLPAISALAAALQPHLDEDLYLAGLWHNDLHRGLLWGVHSEATNQPGSAAYRQHPPSLYVAPSWSWASLFGVFTSYDWVKQMTRPNDWVPVMEILSAGRSLRGANQYGEIGAAMLKLEGKIAEVYAQDMRPFRVEARTKFFHNRSFREDEANSISVYNLDLNGGPASGSLFAFGVLSFDEAQDEYEEYISGVLCLIIAPTGRQIKSVDEYTRIGVARLTCAHFQKYAISKTLFLV